MPTEILMPALFPTMEEGTLAKWHVAQGDSVAHGDVLADIETDKATLEYEAEHGGVIGKLLVAEGTASIPIETAIAVLLEDGESVEDLEPKHAAVADQGTAALETPPTPSALKTPETARLFASPLARRIAAQADLDLAEISGSGPGGRIVKADVEAVIQNPDAPRPSSAPRAALFLPGDAEPLPTPASTALLTETPAPLPSDRRVTQVPLDAMRKTIAARVTQAKQEIPHAYLRRDIQLDALLALRTELNAKLAPRGLRLSINDFIMKACAHALQSVPAANAIWAGDHLLRFATADIAVSVAVAGGIHTPVVQDVQAKTLSSLSLEIKDLASRARAGTLAPQASTGGSLTLSNLGMYGIESFDAVIKPPQSAILAVGAGVKKPVVTADGTLGVATVMSATLSVDHRVIDGALGAELLAAITEGIETPLLLLA